MPAPEEAAAHPLVSALRHNAVNRKLATISEPAPAADDTEHQGQITAAMDMGLPPVEARALIEAPTARTSKRRAAVDLAVAAAGPDDAQKAAKLAAPGKRTAALEAAQRGDLPAVPDFPADTHKPYRAKLAKLIALVEEATSRG